MNPLRPGTHKAPTGQRLNISLAFADNKQRWQRAAFRINEVIERIPSVKRDVPTDEAPKVTKQEKRTATLAANAAAQRYFMTNNNAIDNSLNSPGMCEEIADKMRKLVINECNILYGENAVRYDYLLDANTMDMTMAAIDRILTEDILSGSDFWTSRFFLNPNLAEAVVDGTTDSFESAARITTGTPVEANIAALSAQQQLQSPAYLDRLRLTYGRVFEEMKGLTGDVKAQLRITLTEGVARGVGIRDLKGMINKRLGVGMVRAERIARTEMNAAYTNAYMDESKELNETALKDDDWHIMQVQRSALAPSTRRTHGARHGLMFTVQQMKDWWAINGNRINCLCATLDVLVDSKTGEILQQKMLDTMAKQRGEWFPSN